jgi:hypothetical protein
MTTVRYTVNGVDLMAQFKTPQEAADFVIDLRKRFPDVVIHKEPV